MLNLRPLNEGDCAFRSKVTPKYNCVGYAIGEYHWYDPTRSDGTRWPDDLPSNDFSIAAYERFFEREGYQRCDGPELEGGFEKIAIFRDENDEFCHVARQRPDGVWVSKLGALEDIEHPLEPMSGTKYGTICQYRKRPVRASTLAPLPEEYRL
jgi:hypothetical protein